MFQSAKNHVLSSLQAVKEAIGISPVEVDPEYVGACDRVELLSLRIGDYLRDIRQLTELIGGTSCSGVKFFSSLLRATEGVKGLSPTVALSLSTFFQDTDRYLRRDFLTAVEHGVIENLASVRLELERLRQLRRERHDARLLCNMWRDGAAKAGKDDAAHVRREHLARQQQVDELTKRFISTANALWAQRFTIFGNPLELMMRFFFAFVEDTQKAIDRLQVRVAEENAG
jgi:hypothetical protein